MFRNKVITIINYMMLSFRRAVGLASLKLTIASANTLIRAEECQALLPFDIIGLVGRQKGNVLGIVCRDLIV